MSKRSSATWIGGFVVGAAALVVIGVVMFGSGRYFKTTLKYVSYFDGDVKGLSSGAQVNFRGVQVGQVEDVQVVVDVTDGSIRIPVYYEIDPESVNEVGDGLTELDAEEYMDLLIEKGLRAQLAVRSFLTGQLCIELDFYPEEPIHRIRAETEVTEIPTVPSRFEMITQSLQEIPFKEISETLLSVARNLDVLISSPRFEESFVALNHALDRVASLSWELERRLGPLAENFNAAVTETRELVHNVDQELLPGGRAVLDQAEGTMGSAQELVATLNQQVVPLLTDLEQTSKAVRGSLERADRAMASMDSFVSEDSEVRYRLIQTLEELSQAARTVRFLAEYLEQNPQALIQGKTQPGGR
ncbi:MAG: MlaD family protein [Desulfohalobiaceae bacterium]